ncbi:MAG: LLM class F420-dependent oxidoreductase [Actinomycetota bacterium]|nr:LLM class F420-dependent oxidoreductase [Actinomycetota bacterium]MDG2120622.1 LLM class F420-dependent oxidoreductase [Actinomycetota bacterium]
MKIGLFTPLRSPAATPEFLREFAQGAESMGVNSFWLGEHVVTFDQYDSKYPGSSDGVFRFPEGSGLMDMVSSIGFLAACTKTLRLGTGICILPQNNPVYVAKEYGTLDFLSGGRLDFGVGVGWSWEEFEALGAPWPNRGKRCDEYLEVITSCWTDEVSSFYGDTYQLAPCRVYPKPVQKPMVPITVGGHSDAALKRTARYGSGWYGINLSPSESKSLIDRLAKFMAEENRDVSELEIHIGAIDDTIDPALVEAYKEAGVTQLLIPFLRQGLKHLDSNLTRIEPFVEAANSLS